MYGNLYAEIIIIIIIIIIIVIIILRNFSAWKNNLLL